jgi:hypothetical protein
VTQEMIATACLALAAARAVHKDVIHGAVKHLTALFAQKRNELIDPEAWKHIESAVTNPAAYPGLEVRPGWTIPWLLRVALCVALHRDGGAAGTCSDNVLQVWRRVARQVPPEGLVGVGPEPAPIPPKAPSPVPVPHTAPIILTIRSLDPAGRLAEGNRVRLSTGDLVGEVLTPDPTAPYHLISELLNKTILYPFRSAAMCVVDPVAAWVNWEVVLDPTGQRMYNRRTSDKDLPAPNLMNWDRPDFHTLTFHHAGADLAGSAFGATQRWNYSTDPRSVKPEGLQPGSIQILHVVSDVVETSGGARLSFSSERESDRGTLSRADELPRLLPDIRLYILQLPVGLNDGRRDGVCREKAALLRAFAAQLQLASHQIVITLPGLRFPEGRMLLESIARGVLSPTPTAAVSIFGELSKARAQLFQTLPPEENEAGFDVCYFG